MKRILYIPFILSMLLGAVSCSDDETPKGETVDNAGTIADFIAGNENYTLLNEAIERVGLSISLDGTTNYTLFAPSNSAFETFLLTNDFATLAEVPNDTLTRVMLNHLMSGVRMSSSFNGYDTSLAEEADNNLTLYFKDSPVRINNNSQITNGDTAVSNGIVHGVDEIISFPTVWEFLESNQDFSLFREAAIAASDDELNYMELFSGIQSTFTVYAPNNSAFETLYDEIGIQNSSELSVPTLRKILNYHVVTSENLRTDELEDGQEITTNQGEVLTASLNNGSRLIDAAGFTANITIADIQSLNGVIQQVDKVLLSQESLAIVDPTLATYIETNPTLSLLSMALQITGLDVVLDNRTEEFTVLAPNNSAFNFYLAGEDIDDIPVGDLTALLLNHVVAGSVLSGDLATGYINTQATYDDTNALLSMYVNTDAGVQFNGVSTVIDADNSAANGTIHIVDAVIPAPTITTFVLADSGFSSLETAITRADQPDYAGIFSDNNGAGQAPFTLFAPTDLAFSDLLTELGITSITEINATTLTAALNTHAVAQTALRAEDLETGTLNTLGSDISIDADTLIITDPNGRESNIEIVNIQAANGTLHTINKVLLGL